MTSRRRLNYDMPEKPLIVQQQESTTPVRPPLPSDVTYISPLMQHQQDSTSTCSSNSSSSSSPTLKARDSDESGFSSIGSFQEVCSFNFLFFCRVLIFFSRSDCRRPTRWSFRGTPAAGAAPRPTTDSAPLVYTTISTMKAARSRSRWKSPPWRSSKCCGCDKREDNISLEVSFKITLCL